MPASLCVQLYVTHISFVCVVCVCVCVCVCSNYGRADLSRKKFQKLISQLDDNVLYLCMAQVGQVCVAVVDTVWQCPVLT